MQFGIKDEIIDRIQQVFAHVPEIDEAILFGSRAKGNFKPGSDIDIALVGDGLKLSLVNKTSLLLDDLMLPYTFDLAVLKQITNDNLLSHIERVGVILYSKNWR